MFLIPYGAADTVSVTMIWRTMNAWLAETDGSSTHLPVPQASMLFHDDGAASVVSSWLARVALTAGPLPPCSTRTVAAMAAPGATMRPAARPATSQPERVSLVRTR